MDTATAGPGGLARGEQPSTGIPSSRSTRDSVSVSNPIASADWVVIAPNLS